ncbi:MAG: hypothetical protein KY457_15095 [Actinobacteria bacterium]|nr:hypothetical protein [Actinomycetota bacterium]
MEHGTDLAAALDDGAGRASRTDLHDPVQRAAVEAALTAVPGVVAARLVPGFAREVDELHVMTTLEKGPKQIVRDVQSTLMARFGVTTDHRVISVVQLDEDDAPRTVPGRRVLISSVTVTQQGLESAVEVVLTDGGEELVGHSAGPASTAGRRRATGRATLAAILPLLAENRMVELEGTEVTDVLGRRIALSLVHFHSVKGGWTVCGSAMVRDDESEAIARSVLDAVNRSLEDATS